MVGDGGIVCGLGYMRFRLEFLMLGLDRFVLYRLRIERRKRVS